MRPASRTHSGSGPERLDSRSGRPVSSAAGSPAVRRDDPCSRVEGPGLAASPEGREAAGPAPLSGLPRRADPREEVWCFLCRASFDHCWCGADPAEMRQALAVISQAHFRTAPYGLCAHGACGNADACVCVGVLERVRARLVSL